MTETKSKNDSLDVDALILQIMRESFLQTREYLTHLSSVTVRELQRELGAVFSFRAPPRPRDSAPSTSDRSDARSGRSDTTLAAG